MKIRYICSNCGKAEQTSAMVGVPEGMYMLGYRAVGDALYCPNCVSTWEKRNGKLFDEYYNNPKHLFAKWWNREVDRQAEVECKNVKTYRVYNGVYVDTTKAVDS